MILKALKELRDTHPRKIVNYNYRGEMEIHPFFTVKEIAKKIGRTPATTRKWCKVLASEESLILKWKKCYTMNDPETMLFRRADLEKIKLKWR